MRFLSVAIFSLTFLLIGAGCIQSPLFEYIVKNADDTCPEGQKMSYTFTGAGFAESGCRDIAPDAGKVCSSNEDCTNDCFVTSDYLDQLDCIDTRTLCSETQSCSGIRGRCEAIPGEAGITIPKSNTVYAFCDE
ncbi:MAG TPA: hypothetical protein VJB99_02590 [Patescibacteria group bacterium]|nr:hypothetical protein [Patescibacteria group bacterium]